MSKIKKAAGAYHAAMYKTQDHCNKSTFPDPIIFYEKELLKLKNKGETAIALCPFHDDHEPSFSFYTKNGHFKCFACGAKGSMIDFCMMKYRLSYLEAMKCLIEGII